MKGCCVWEEEEEKVRCEIDQLKSKGPQLSTICKKGLTFIHVCHTGNVPLADIGVECFSISKGCCVWEEKEERVRCEMDQIKTTKDHHYQQLARKDVLCRMFEIALDMTHLLMSALNEEAP